MVATLTCSLILVSGWVYCSYLSSVYTILGIALWLSHIISRRTSRLILICLFYSLFCLILKIIIFTNYFSESTKNFIDITSSQEKINSQFWVYLIPDLSVALISFLSRFIKYNLTRFKVLIISISMFILAMIGISVMSLCNLLYLLFFLLYFQGLISRINILKRICPIIISGLLTIHLSFPTLTRFYPDILTTSEMSKLGLIDFRDWNLNQVIQFILIIWNHSFFSFISENYHKSFNSDLKIRLLKEVSFNETHDQVKIFFYIKYIILYFFECFLLWLWAIVYRGPSGLVIMSWIFFSLLSKSNYLIKNLSTWILTPTLIFSFTLNVLSSIFNLEFTIPTLLLNKFSTPILETCFCLIAIIMVTVDVYYLNNFSADLNFENFTKNWSDTWYGLTCGYVFKRIYLFSLIVLFFISLSDINVLHSGLTILCLFFMTNTYKINSEWKWLLTYVMGMLYIRYIYNIAHPVLSEYVGENHLMWFGLKEQEAPTHLNFIPYDYLIWVLFVSASLQHKANSIEIKTDMDADGHSRKNFILATIKDILDFLSSIEIFVLYTLMFTVLLISKTNLLNFFRLAILAVIFFQHFKTNDKVLVNFKQLYPILVVLEAYSALLLTSRYLYQFQIYTQLNVDFPLIGYELYEKDLFANIGSDWANFIFSVLATRNCKERAKISNSKIMGIDTKRFYYYLSEPFQYFLFGVIYYHAIYSKIGLSMLINIYIIGLYGMYLLIYYSFTQKGIKRTVDHELRIRELLFFIIFFNTLLAVCLSYFRFLITDSNPLIKDWYEILDWSFYIFGFTVKSDVSLPITESYPYLMILITCILERQCLDYLRIEIKMNEKRLQMFQTNQLEVLKRELSNCKVKIFLKSLVESLISMGTMLLAFDKITIISVVYIGSVFFTSCSPDMTFTGLIYIVIIFMVDVQYTLILSNINQITAGFVPSSEKPIQIPWFDYQNWPNSDRATFFNMGTNKDQLQGLFWDMIVMIIIMMYFNYLFGSEQQKEELVAKLKAMESLNLVNEENEDDKNMVKVILENLKNYFYIFSRLIVTAILLLFVTQGQGLVSMPYIVFCMVFIYIEINTMKSNKFSSYTDLLSWFLKYIIIDLTSQILVQIPFLMINDPQLMQIFNIFFSTPVNSQEFKASFYKWCNYIGLMKLWKASELELELSFFTILSKIYCYTLLFMIYRMMKTKDYNDFNRERFKSIENKAHEISVKMSQNFNDDRINKNKFYTESKGRFIKELEKLEENLKKLNKRYDEQKSCFELSKSKSIYETLQVPQQRPSFYQGKISVGSEFKPLSAKVEYSLTSRIIASIVNSINVYLFDDFLDKITPFGKMNLTASNLISANGIKAKKRYYRTLASLNDGGRRFSLLGKTPKNDSESESDQEVNLNESFEKEKIEYDFVWTLYPKLIFYFLASQTEALVFCSFFLNHYYYASLESIILPLSVVGYAMLEYPRPRPKYFRIMMVYTQFVIILKFFLQIELIVEVIGKETMKHYYDPLKIGFNIAANTYSETIFYYIFWDVVVILCLLFHQQYLYKVGLDRKTETDIENLEQAKARKQLKVIIDEDKTNDFFGDLLMLSKEEKPGNWYSYTIFIEIIILIYIFFFFSKLDGSSINIQQSFRNNQFQGRMVAALMVQMGLIIIDRYFYVKQTTFALTQTSTNKMAIRIAIYFRVIIHILLCLMIHILCFWYFPINGNYNITGSAQCDEKIMNDSQRCNNFEVNNYLKYFYLLFLAYFIFSALQIKYGMPSFKRNAFPLTRIVSPISLGLFKVYRSAPFFFELRTLIDWASTDTCLTIFQWFKFEDINSQLFINKCTQNSLETKKIGDSIPLIEKCYMGVFSIFLILFIILAPLIVFSTMNPIINYNKVKSASLQISLSFNQREFEIYKINTADEIHGITEDEWHRLEFNKIPELVASDIDIMQKISMPSESDTVWDISPPAYKKLCDLLGQDLNISFYINTVYKFSRNFPETRRKVELERINEIQNRSIINELKGLICDESSAQIVIPNIFHQLVRLPSNVNSINPTVIEEARFASPLILNYNADGKYWSAETLNFKNKSIGVRFFTLSDRFSKLTLNYSVNSMFVSVVLALGLTIKLLSRGSAYYLSFSEMKKTDYLETLCAGVYVSRMIGDIKKEEELYYELIDILRSPETTKMITGKLSIKKVKND